MNGDVIRMLHEDAITKRRGLQLRREIMVCDEKDEREYINGVFRRFQII